MKEVKLREYRDGKASDANSEPIKLGNFDAEFGAPKLSLAPLFSGTSWYTFAFLPFCIIPAVLEHMFQLSSSMIVVLNLNNKWAVPDNP